MTRRFSEPYKVSEPTQWAEMRVRTTDGITHGANPEWRPLEPKDARTYCDQRVHFGKDAESNSRTRRFSARIADDAVIDCITCLVVEAKRQQ